MRAWAVMCDVPYFRNAQRIPCTFIKEHPSPNHSWFALKVQDEVDAEMETWAMTTRIPEEMVPLIAALTSGAMDDCLEVILAAAHGRKRARHGRGPSVSTERRND
jgi:hypothetical protein